METPFRNQHLLEDLLNTCNPQTLLCLAVSITTGNERIRTQTIEAWKKSPPDISQKAGNFYSG
jgi:16S rRNA (cytidine1402-2'-O)-methyltransferase